MAGVIQTVSARVAAHPRLNLVGRIAHEEIYARMRSASYLVMPSIRYENLPRVLIEAFGNGLPIVASHRGSFLDLVDHGATGLLFRPGSLFVEGVASPHSLMKASRGRYGEAAGEWSAADAAGFCRIEALPGMLHARAGSRS